MFIIWGSRSMDKTLGETQRSYQCQHCNNVNRYKVFRRRNWFTLFWIPIFPFSNKYFIACPICNFGSQLKKQDALDQLQVQTEIQQQVQAQTETPEIQQQQ